MNTILLYAVALFRAFRAPEAFVSGNAGESGNGIGLLEILMGGGR